MKTLTALKILGALKIFAALAVIAAFLVPCFAFAAAPAADAQAETGVFSLGRCISKALESQPDLKIARSNLNISRNSLTKTISSLFPQAKASASYSVWQDNLSASAADDYSAKISLTQNIWDFGKTIDSLRLDVEDRNSGDLFLQDKIREIILSVTQQYYEYLKTKRLAEMDSESLRQSEEHLSQAKDFYQAGIKSRIDVTKAEVQKANDRLSLISAVNKLKIAKLRLGNAIGMKQADFEVENTVDTTAFDIGLEYCLERAFRSRPDVLEMESSIRSARINLSSSVRRMFLEDGSGIQAKAEYDFHPEGSSWNAGVGISIPLFTGFSNISGLNTARENLSIALERKKSLELSVRLEVEQAYLTMQEKKESIDAAAEGLRNAEENFSLAQGRYLSGIGSMIELADAQTTLTGAKTNHINSLYDYAESVASLRKSAGLLDAFYIP